MVIGGFSSNLAHHLTDAHQKEHAELIRQASHKIDSVINSLENLTEISVTRYTPSGTAQMIDLKQELEKNLEEADAPAEKQ
jgi:hypothetical protein